MEVKYPTLSNWVLYRVRHTRRLIPVFSTHSFATPDSGHEMSPQEMERRKKSMILTGSVYTKFETLYELDDGTTMFTFLVKKTVSSPGAAGMGSVGAQAQMHYDDYHMTQPPPEFPVPGTEAVSGCRVVRQSKKKHTTTVGSADSPKPTSSKSRKSSGVGIGKTLDFSGHRTTIVLAPRVRALKVLRVSRRTVSWRVFYQVAHGPAMTDSWTSHLFYVKCQMSANKSASAALHNSTTH